MKICENGIVRDMTPEEIAELETAQVAAENEYWRTISYDVAVDAEIRKHYSVSQEFAILRQREEKPEEYAAYYACCEDCKTYVKTKLASYARKEEVK